MLEVMHGGRSWTRALLPRMALGKLRQKSKKIIKCTTPSADPSFHFLYVSVTHYIMLFTVMSFLSVVCNSKEGVRHISCSLCTTPKGWGELEPITRWSVAVPVALGHSTRTVHKGTPFQHTLVSCVVCLNITRTTNRAASWGVIPKLGPLNMDGTTAPRILWHSQGSSHALTPETCAFFTAMCSR